MKILGHNINNNNPKKINKKPIKVKTHPMKIENSIFNVISVC